MKKIKFRERTFMKVFKTVWKFLLGIVLGLLLGYIVYPSFALTKVDYNCKVVNKIGGYTYYNFNGSHNFSRKVNDPTEVGEMSMIKIKLKDHKNYSEDENIERETTILIVYCIIFLIALGVTLFTEETYLNPLSFWNGFMISSILSIIFILIKCGGYEEICIPYKNNRK